MWPDFNPFGFRGVRLEHSEALMDRAGDFTFFSLLTKLDKPIAKCIRETMKSDLGNPL